MLKRVFIIGLAAVAFAGCKRLPPPPVVPSQATPVPVVAGSPQTTLTPATDASPTTDAKDVEAIINNNIISPGRESRPPQPAPTPSLSVQPHVSSSYQPFTLAAYNAAKAAGRPILLYFYANWCPLCRPQEPINVSVFGDAAIRPLGIAGFRVNYNDNETDGDEQALARQFGVNYQHTFITIGSDGSEIWRTTGTQTREQLIPRLQALR